MYTYAAAKIVSTATYNGAGRTRKVTVNTSDVALYTTIVKIPFLLLTYCDQYDYS